MTTSTTAREVEKRRSPRAPQRRLTATEDLLEALRAAWEAEHRIRFPDPYWWQHPVEFFEKILGVTPWSKQVEILEAVRDNKRVAVASGHKTGKSMSAAGLALCFFASFEAARVVMSSTTSRQVDQILWRELTMMRAKSGRCVECKAKDPDGRIIPRPCQHSALIEGDIGMLARTGLKSDDFREVVGFTAREAEAVAGISGANLLYIIDEASGVPEEIFEAIEGNRAGGARIVMFSNPTKTSGTFFDAFHSKAKFYKTITISSEETPNVVEGRDVIPGLATRDWIEEKRDEWGEDSPLYNVRAKGKFATREDGKIFSIATITEAEERWEETTAEGRLYIGIDPAGPTGSGDETVFTPRRGRKAFAQLAKRSLDADGILSHLVHLITQHKIPRETPVVVIDREGQIGTELLGKLKLYLETVPGAFELVPVRASDRAVRQPQVFDRMRDELTANLESWFRDGGAIVGDAKLAAELHEPEWFERQDGRLKVTPKDAIRKALGRSPDRYDSLALACWEPLSLRDGAPPSAPGASQPRNEYEQVPAGLDPYGGTKAFERR